MDFGPVSINDAMGCILAHSIHINGAHIAKGIILENHHITLLRQADVHEITVARLYSDDVHEDDAAFAIGQAFSGTGLVARGAEKGRVNIHAQYDGVLCLNAKDITALNDIDEAITLSTLMPFQRVKAGQMLATIKIITFAVARERLNKALEHIKSQTLHVAAFIPQKATLILTHGNWAALSEKIRDKTIKTISARLKERGADLIDIVDVPHDINAVSDALKGQAKDHLILMMGISAIVDRRDILPAALVDAGGRIKKFGMAVDPGNLTMVGKLGDTPIIGLPGCARSPKLNGFDWVLDRICAGLEISSEDWAHMSIGGLLKEISSRPQPRIKPRSGGQTVKAIILAAGTSSRMGDANKLLTLYKGKPLLSHVIEAVKTSPVDEYCVITGHEAEKVGEYAGPQALYCADYKDGMAESLKCGVRHFIDAGALMICLGDMPNITAAHMAQLIDAFNAHDGLRICAASYHGKRGNPVIIPKAYFEDMLQLEGDQGARQLFTRHAEQVELVNIDDEAVLQDFDDPGAFQ